MTMEVNGTDVAKLMQTLQTQRTDAKENTRLKPIVQQNGTAAKKITNADVEKALNEPHSSKAVLGLLQKSPVGLGEQQSREDIEELGYTFTTTAFHPGAPVIYNSADGGTIRVYNGKGTAEMGEDQRKTVYENGNYKQEMFYDENGKLTQCTVTIKDAFGNTERKMDMLIDENGKKSFIDS